MKIAFACDDDNETTTAVERYLHEAEHEVLHPAVSRDWPEVGTAVAKAVVDGVAEFGIVMCWTGTGTAMAANKVAGVRAALAWDPWIAQSARKWNDANVLAMSLKRLSPDVAVEVTQAFLSVPEPDDDERPAIERLSRLDSPTTVE